MEMLRTLILIESLVLGLLLCVAAGYFYLLSRRITDTRVFGLLTLVFYYCMPGILGALSPTLLRIVVPMARPDVQLPMAIALPLLMTAVFTGIFIRFGRPRRMKPKRQWRLAKQLATQYRPGRLFLVSLGFFCLGLIGVYRELHAAGGWFAVLRGGSSAYMEARVTQAVGFWGVLVCFIPIAAIGMMYATSFSRAVPRGLRWPLVLMILSAAIGLISLLTVRHQSMMLLLALIALLEVKSRKLFRLLAPAVLILIVIGAVALASLRYSSRARSIDQLSGNFEEIEVSERIISTFHAQGYVWGGNIPDLFVVMVPRAIWHNKPMGSSINRAVFFEFAKMGGVKVVGILGEGYASGGLIMVAIEGLVYGIMLRRMRGFWNRRQQNSYQFMAYGSIVLGYIYIVVHNGFISPNAVTFFAMLGQVWTTSWLCGYLPAAEKSRNLAQPQTSEPVTA
jgi:hypothetical protein